MGPELPLDGAHHLLHFRAPRDVGPDRLRPPSRLPDLPRRSLGIFFPLAIIHRYVAACPRQSERDGTANPAARAGDQRYFPGDVFHHLQVGTKRIFFIGLASNQLWGGEPTHEKNGKRTLERRPQGRQRESIVNQRGAVKNPLFLPRPL